MTTLTKKVKSINNMSELDNINWKKISQYEKLSEEFIEKFKDKVNFWRISQYQKLSEEFIQKFQDKVNWSCISQYQKLNEEFIKKFQDKVNWIHISQYQKLSEEFIKEFKIKIFPRFLLKNKNQKYYSTQFIIDFKPYFNNYYYFNFYANKIRNYWLAKYYYPGNIGYLKTLQQLKI